MKARIKQEELMNKSMGKLCQLEKVAMETDFRENIVIRYSCMAVVNVLSRD